jgi:hypothetical protein
MRAVSEPVQRSAARMNPPCECAVPPLLKLRAGCRYQLLQSILGRSAHQTAKFLSHFSLIPPRWVPPKGAALIKLH